VGVAPFRLLQIINFNKKKRNPAPLNLFYRRQQQGKNREEEQISIHSSPIIDRYIHR